MRGLWKFRLQGWIFKADEVLSTAARGIAEVITHHYTQNIDLRDAKTVLSNSGTAIMGASTAVGENRAKKAITNALDSPLLNDNKISGAKNVLLLIVSDHKKQLMKLRLMIIFKPRQVTLPI